MAEHLLGLAVLLSPSTLLLLLVLEATTLLSDLRAPGRELFEPNHAGLVSIQQPLVSLG